MQRGGRRGVRQTVPDETTSVTILWRFSILVAIADADCDCSSDFSGDCDGGSSLKRGLLKAHVVYGT